MIAKPVVNVMHRELQCEQQTGFARDCHVTWEGLLKERRKRGEVGGGWGSDNLKLLAVKLGIHD